MQHIKLDNTYLMHKYASGQARKILYKHLTIDQYGIHEQKFIDSLDDKEQAMYLTMKLFIYGDPDLEINPKELKSKLYLNKNCHSCVILGHQNLLDIYNKYNVVILDGNSSELYPRLIDDTNSYFSIELNKKLYENIDVKDISNEDLIKMCTNYHINCNAENCIFKEITIDDID